MRSSQIQDKENHQSKLEEIGKREYAKLKDDSVSAKLAYFRHDDVQPEDVTDDPSEDLQRLKNEYYLAHVVVDEKAAPAIEMSTREQSNQQHW